MNLLDFSVLGPLEARADGRVLELGSGRHLALLAFLLLHAGETVSRSAIFDALWREPPATAPKMVHNYVSRLRKALGADTIRTHGAAYALAAPRESLDAVRFERLLRGA